MRDILFTCIMVYALPACFLRPWVGVLVWSWLGYMNPHRLCYGFAYNLVPWAEMVAIATLAGLVSTKERRSFIWCRESIMTILLWIWCVNTTLFAFYPDDAWFYLERFSKTLLMVLLTIPLIRSRAHLRWLLLVIAGSVGFYGFKGGVFVILTGGNYIVWGPAMSFMASNNSLALGLNMSLPLFWYLRKDEPRRWVRRALLATFWLSAIAVLFSYSRGGALGLGTVLLMLFARSKRWYLALPLLGLAGVLLFAIAPEKWVEKMQSVETYEQDQSAMSRLQAWQMGIKIANDRPFLGAGFWAFNHPETYRRYAPELGRRATDAHSIYFNLLGEHGYMGLGLYIILLLSATSSLISMYKTGKRFEGLAWISDYSYMLGSSLTAYLVTGAFLSVAYFDLAWHLFALVIVLKELTKREIETLAPIRVGLNSSAPNPRLAKVLAVPRRLAPETA